MGHEDGGGGGDQQQTTTNNNKMTRDIFMTLLLPQAIVGLLDAVSYMVVAPSLIFYVLEMGGNKELYGIILSAFSFASFALKPVLGAWSDRLGQKYRTPYFTSLGLACLGGFFYFVASMFHDDDQDDNNNSGTADAASDLDRLSSSSTSSAIYNVPIYLILIGRLLGGCGGASATLGYSYIALTIDDGVRTQAIAVLSMVRVMGMAFAPACNMFLDHIDGTIALGRHTMIHITPLNSVGLFLMVVNIISIVTMYIFLVEPSDLDDKSEDASGGDEDDDEANTQKKGEEKAVDTNGSEEEEQEGSSPPASSSYSPTWIDYTKTILSLPILIPILSIFVMNANFQMIETGLAPAAYDVLAYGPVGVSTLFAINAVAIFFAIILTFQLSARGVTDECMLLTGLVFSIVGYTCLYFMWIRDATVIGFFIPLLLSAMAFPFMGAPTRSLFTRNVDRIPCLKPHQGTMQAVLSMAASVAGFTTPGLIAAFVLRTAQQVEASSDQREFTPYALFSTLLSTLTLIGFLYSNSKNKTLDDDNGDDDDAVAKDVVNEATALLGDNTEQQQQQPSPRSHHHHHKKHDHDQQHRDSAIEAHRRESCTLMGIEQIAPSLLLGVDDSESDDDEIGQ